MNESNEYRKSKSATGITNSVQLQQYILVREITKHYY